MRVKITLQALQPQTIEINYNYYLTSLIYHLLSESDVDFSTKLHSEGYALGNKNFKLFCFSRLFPSNHSINADKLIIKGNMDWYISSPIKEFILHLADGLLRRENVNIGQGEFHIRSAEMLRPPVFAGEMSFKSISPITTHTAEIVDGERKTIHCPLSSPKFAENIKNNLIRKYFLLHGTLPQNMSIGFSIDDKYLEDRGKLIAYKDTRIKCYQIPFNLKCDSKLMEVAYDCGIGEKGSAGFGCIEVRR